MTAEDQYVFRSLPEKCCSVIMPLFEMSAVRCLKFLTVCIHGHV